MKDITQLPVTHDQLLYLLAVSQMFISAISDRQDLADENSNAALKRMNAIGPDGIEQLHNDLRRLHDAICDIPLERL